MAHLTDPDSSRDALRDGRQSAEALDIRRGVMRLLQAHNLAGVPELTLATGRRADVVAVSSKSDIWIVEIKSCVADFRADQKWPDYLDFCDRLYFAVNHAFPVELLPDAAGIIVADRYGGEIIRVAPEDRLAAARRKAVSLAFARAAAFRLMAVMDPEIVVAGGLRSDV